MGPYDKFHVTYDIFDGNNGKKNGMNMHTYDKFGAYMTNLMVKLFPVK